jgi:ABC-type lipoprotein release transport system permease subunit
VDAPIELRLAWRNVWRNSRRTGLTVAATVFAVLLVVVFVAMGAGVHEKMIEDAVRLGSGHLAVSGAGYRENQTLDHHLDFDPALARALEDLPGVQAVAPRLVGYGLLSKEDATEGAVLYGVDPERERSFSSLADRVQEGRFVGPPGGVVLGGRLAARLSASPGEEVLLYSVAYSLEMAYELFEVVGVLDLPDPTLDGSLALLRLQDAQRFFVFEGRITELAVLAEDPDALGPLEARVKEVVAERVTEPVEVVRWEELMPALDQIIFLDDAGMYMMLAILVVVVGFGILNTVLMAVLERRRELGVMLALGLRPGAIFRLVYLESMMLALVGLAIGLGLALPLVLYLQGHPIPLGGGLADASELFGFDPVITFQLKPLNPVGSTLTILAVAAVAALYPAVKASRARPVDALRSL